MLQIIPPTRIYFEVEQTSPAYHSPVYVDCWFQFVWHPIKHTLVICQ